MIHRLPDLPWPVDALEPLMSRQTLELHHGKHHAGYVAKLNKLIEGTGFAGKSLEDIVLYASGEIYNNAAQHWNHSFFWPGLRPAGGAGPDEALAAAISARFESFAALRRKFSDAAAAQFGSGWTWLVADPDGGLDLVNTSNAGNPLSNGRIPLLVCDVWEHAYYLDYQNKRPDYVAAFWAMVDWDRVSQRYGAPWRSSARPARSSRA